MNVQSSNTLFRFLLTAIGATLFVCSASSFAFAKDDKAPPRAENVKHRVLGLFSPDREADLGEVVGQLPGVELVSVDYERGEATFHYNAAELFPGTKPEQILERFDFMVRQACRGTFRIRPLCTIPREKLEYVEIAVVGLDCKGCSLGAYEAVSMLDGVERATASFRDGLVTAWIDPAKTNRAALEAALTKKRVPLVTP